MIWIFVYSLLSEDKNLKNTRQQIYGIILKEKNKRIQ